VIKSRKPEAPTSSAPLPLRSLSSWPSPKRLNDIPEDHQKLFAYRMEIFTDASNNNNNNNNGSDILVIIIGTSKPLRRDE